MVRGETTDALPVTVWSPEGTLRAGPACRCCWSRTDPSTTCSPSLSRYSGALIAAGRLPPHRLALLEPVQRNAWYSGSPQYLRTQMGAGLARLRRDYGVHGAGRGAWVPASAA